MNYMFKSIIKNNDIVTTYYYFKRFQKFSIENFGKKSSLYPFHMKKRLNVFPKNNDVI